MKEWKELTLTDDYLFSQIMKDEEFCKLLNYKSNLPRSSKRSKPFPANKRYPYGRLP